ncbi:MAG: primosomal protein N' [Clostridiaceae bacterium]|nr:primosomal protein N' [Clostridiaceae bacterium]
MEKTYKIAKVAVSSAVFSFDKPFDYIVEDESYDIAVGQRVLVPFGRGNKPTEGFVLSVSDEMPSSEGLKKILYLYNDGVCLSQNDISLALWMRNKYFCSFFECANAMIPPGLWSKPTGRFHLACNSDMCSAQKEESDILDALRESKKPMTIEQLKKATQIKKIEWHIKALVDNGFIEDEKVLAPKNFQKMIIIVSLISGASYDQKVLGRGEAREKRVAILSQLREKGPMPENELCYQTGAQPSIIRDLERKGLVSFAEQPSYIMPEHFDYLEKGQAPIKLSAKQQNIYNGLLKMTTGPEASCALLHGVTGSGKTAVYIELIRHVLSLGKSAMMLVPEIALTPQMLREFRMHFGSSVAVVHSNLPLSKRYEEYMRIKTGRAKVIIGTRSAVLSPCVDLGIIIIDEEHETTYKSDASPRYNAVDIAKYRCVKAQCLLLLGSATPSVESYYNALSGKYTLFTLDERYNEAPLPKTVIADMRESLKNGDDLSISKTLRDELQKNIANCEQSILFINRRGNAKMAMCAECGYVPQCENCSVSLTYHSANGRLMCHHCGYSHEFITKCPECGSTHIKLIGAGTQKVENELSELFPEAKVLRMDADTTTGRRSHEEILDAFGNGEADILIGTQMVAKGLDFPNVTLVGVIDGDLPFYEGSYISGERSFSLISQVVGRAGRRDKPGRAVIQTFSPQNPVIESASEQDYVSFYNHEIGIRELVKAPPFYDIFTFFFTSENEDSSLQAAKTMAAGLNAAFEGKYSDIKMPVLGPSPAAIAKINKKYRFTVTFKGHETKESRKLVSDMLIWFSSVPQSRGITVAADINTLNY